MIGCPNILLFASRKSYSFLSNINSLVLLCRSVNTDSRNRKPKWFISVSTKSFSLYFARASVPSIGCMPQGSSTRRVYDRWTLWRAYGLGEGGKGSWSVFWATLLPPQTQLTHIPMWCWVKQWNTIDVRSCVRVCVSASVRVFVLWPQVFFFAHKTWDQMIKCGYVIGEYVKNIFESLHKSFVKQIFKLLFVSVVCG